MSKRTAILAAFLVASGLMPTPLLAQEPVVIARSGAPASTWTASYVYDCTDTRVSFYLSVKAGQPRVSDFDFGRGAEPAIDQRINEALANQWFTDVVVVCAPDGLGSSATFRTNKIADNGSSNPAWVRVGATPGADKVAVTAGDVTE